MPAITSNHASEATAPDAPLDLTDVPNGDATPTLDVASYLDMAVEAARQADMSASELMGMFFYYAHSVAEGFRMGVISEQEAREAAG